MRLDDWAWADLDLSMSLRWDITHIAREEGDDDAEVGDDPSHHQDDVGSAKKGLHHRAVDSAAIKSINVYKLSKCI